MSNPRIDGDDDGRNSKDVELARRALVCDAKAFQTIMRMHNQRLYRIARGLANDDSEAEDIVQEAYVNAFAHFAEFRGESTLSTWLCRIVVNEALGRLEKKRREAAFAASGASSLEIAQFSLNRHSDDAERTMAQRQILRLVEQAIDTLPHAYRVVFPWNPPRFPSPRDTVRSRSCPNQTPQRSRRSMLRRPEDGRGI